ncbi:hypothetical protein Goarm_018093 [Gossypium armourianum]|uniref:DUF7950 domain-containing protein n=1 Tax=Gossypium armourianum TaxID=34283 RepID=A0A7J9IHB6_9ROSI|nr:hypothetical protein [Gossypium armourianum]
MEGRGGCSIARYEAYGVYDTSKMDRIMLRFRPIAPKPATGGGSGETGGGTEVCYKSGRRKRRHTKGSITKRKRRVTTLSLISETPDCKDCISKETKTMVATPSLWLSSGESDAAAADDAVYRKESLSFVGGGGESLDRAVRMVVGSSSSSCVTVESVTETWVSGGGWLECTDEEMKVNLGKDLCPGFISDVFGRVTWTNGAYKEMVGGGGRDMTTVRLLMKQKLPPATIFPAFTCRVRVQYSCGKDRKSLTLPCDVWRMNGGGIAWRLDINAALCLGR